MSESVRMELDELLQREGLEADGAEENLAWARGRALELVGDVAQDPELGPLLEGASLPDGMAPPPPPRSAALDPATSGDGLEVAEHGMETAQAEAPSEAGELAAEPEAEAEPDPLADMDFDGLPGFDEPEAPVEASPAPSEPVVEQGVPDSIEATTTEPSDLPPIPSAAAPAEDDSGEDDEDIEEIEEIELLDDDDLELVEDDEDEEPAAETGGETLPEWKAALTSAQLGGDAKADEDSGLLRPPTSEAPPEASDEAPDDEEG